MADLKISKGRYTVDPLYQWDINQKLKIYGLSILNPEINFTNDSMGGSVVFKPTVDEFGVITVDIPNSLLQFAYPIVVYVTGFEDKTFKTYHKVTIPVKARKRPGDYTLSLSDNEVYSFQAMSRRILDIENELLGDRNSLVEYTYDGDNVRLVEASGKRTIGQYIPKISSTFKAIKGITYKFKTKIDDNKTLGDKALAIAKGINKARVFNTTADMNAWLSDETNKGKAKVGNNLYIVDIGVPDWWISEVLETPDSETGFYYKIAQLETQKVDLTNIESDIDTLQSDVETVNDNISSLGTELNNTNTRVTTLENKPVDMCYLEKTSVDSNDVTSSLPYAFYRGCAVELNNEIHIMGGDYNSSCQTNHYKWDGSTWTQVSTLPYNLRYGSAVVLNGEIHILGSNVSGNETKHYKWNGTTWESVSTLPYIFQDGCAVIKDGYIHILGTNYSDYTLKHYRWNGSSWTSISTLPFDFYYGTAVVIFNKIHIMGGGSTNSHYVYNGSWTALNNLPYYYQKGCAVFCKGRIHLLGSDYASNTYTHHCKLKCGLVLGGYVKANTNIYYPYNRVAISDYLEKTKDGYLVTKDGYREILIG